MPVYHRSNNRVLPANQRTVDVARQAIADLTPVEQRRYHNAFLVQGYECVVYNAHHQGLACSCMAHRASLATLLDEQGKMPPATQNQLLSGLVFEVNLYGRKPATVDNMRETLQSPPQVRPGLPLEGPSNPNFAEPPLRSVGSDFGDPHIGNVNPEGANYTDDAIGANGEQFDLDESLEQFDSGGMISLGDTACGICFGRGYIGGFSPVSGWRAVLTSQWSDRQVDGTIEVNKRPHAFWARSVEFNNVVLPRGFRALDAMRVWNNTKVVDNAKITIDGQLVTYPLLYQVFDGRPHTVAVSFDTEVDWTHLEIQVDLGNEARLEFPRMTKGFDASKLDGTEDVQISLSPIVPHVAVRDLVFESSFGLGFVFTSAQLWNTEKRRVLGWDCQARVIQPNELLNLLPRRNRVQQQKTTNMVRDNQDGRRRT